MTDAVMESLVQIADDCRAPDLVVRVISEYREMPGLRLTAAQAQRLWNLDRARCDAVLGTLTDACVLRRMPDGSFVLA